MLEAPTFSESSGGRRGKGCFELKQTTWGACGGDVGGGPYCHISWDVAHADEGKRYLILSQSSRLHQCQGCLQHLKLYTFIMHFFHLYMHTPCVLEEDTRQGKAM